MNMKARIVSMAKMYGEHNTELGYQIVIEVEKEPPFKLGECEVKQK